MFLEIVHHNFKMLPHHLINPKSHFQQQVTFGICSCNWTSSQSMKLGFSFNDEKLFTTALWQIYKIIYHVATKKCGMS